MSKGQSIKFVVIAALCLVSQFISMADVSASVTSNPWAVEGALSFGEPERGVSKQRCSNKIVNVVGGHLGERLTKACVYERPFWRYAQGPFGLAVGIGIDQNMYKLSDVYRARIGEIVEVPYSNDLHFRNPENSARKGMSVIKDFPSKLRQASSFGGAKVYELTDNGIQPFITSQSIYIRPVGVSDNGRWMALANSNNGFVLRNMETGQLHWFSGHRFGVGISNDASGVVANDGSVVAINGDMNSSSYKAYTLSADCGMVAQSYLGNIVSELEQRGACPDDNGEIGRATDLRFGSDRMYMKISRLSDDKSVLYLRGNSHVYDKYGENEYPLYTNALPQSSKLDYLALGDSYSSGEGDTNRFFWESVYRKGTDEEGPPVERCHISTRSYPYLLAKKYGLQDDKWNTVACSGAHVREDYYGDDEGYLGQGDRLSDIKDEELLQQFKDVSKASFIPGRTKQLEFIKKYQPKVATITGSGNDVNFEGVIRTCVQLFISDDCMYTGSHGATMLGLRIAAQYDKIRKVVDEIKTASPNTTIYYIGYPQFVSGKQACTHISGLSFKERTLFRTATTYLNRVIKAAAESGGAIYIDIENVFEDRVDRTLCNPAPLYVNNFTLGCAGNEIVKWIGGSLDCEESYHPNHLGHQAIAGRIAANHPSLMTDQPCTIASACIKEVNEEDIPVPDLFLQAYADDAAANFTPVPGNGGILVVQKGNPAGNIKVSIPSQRPSYAARPYLTSEPIELGTAYVDAMGVLDVDVPVPDSVAAGYHTLHVETQSFSGEPIKLWWTILILGRDGDIDEDGIPDRTDKCAFVLELGYDRDQDGVDDGCDQYVSPISSAAKTNNKNSISVLGQNDTNGTRPSASESKSVDHAGSMNGSHLAAHDGSQSNPQLAAQPSHTPGSSADATAKVARTALALLLVLVIVLLMLKLRSIYDRKHQE